MNAGRLNQKIQFLTPIKSKLDSGGRTFVFVPYMDTFAEVKEVRSDPGTTDNRLAISTAIVVRIRYRPNLYIKNGDKIIWRGLEYIVDNMKVDPLRTIIEIMVSTHTETSKRSSV